MYLRNASRPQSIVVKVVNDRNGGPITTGVTVFYIYGVMRIPGSGSLKHIAAGLWRYVPTRAETDYDVFVIEFYHENAVCGGPIVMVSTSVPAPIFVAATLRNGRLYQELREPEHRNTRRIPAPHHAMDINAVHSLELFPPYPPAEIAQVDAQHPPDAGGTTPWPYADSTDEVVNGGNQVPMPVVRASRLFQERLEPGHRNTRRIPAPHHAMDINAVHSLELFPPYPPIHVLHADTTKPPDAGSTIPWPYGNED